MFALLLTVNNKIVLWKKILLWNMNPWFSWDLSKVVILILKERQRNGYNLTSIFERVRWKHNLQFWNIKITNEIIMSLTFEQFVLAREWVRKCTRRQQVLTMRRVFSLLLANTMQCCHISDTYKTNILWKLWTL